MILPQDICPCESDSPPGAPGPVSHEESVIRFVPSKNWIVRGAAGQAELSVAAFPEQELEAKKGKSVSVLRCMTEAAELERRAVARNREPSWADDPVVARGTVATMRQLCDGMNRREICVNADPITDELGHCPTHASILRSNPPPDRSQRLQRAMLRLALASLFVEVAHLSGHPITDWGT